MTQGRREQGFTLIELTVVLVVVGLLSAVAVPRFIDLSDQAGQAAVEGVAGSLSSGSAINYAAFKAGADYENVENCTDVEDTLQGGLPEDYEITAAAVAEDEAVECTLTGPDSHTATFQAIGTDAP